MDTTYLVKDLDMQGRAFAVRTTPEISRLVLARHRINHERAFSLARKS